MFGDPIGNAWINREFEHTKIWPKEQFTLTGVIDLEKEYKEAMGGQLCQVMERGVDGSYLIYAVGKKTGPFVWMIEEGDVKGFIPVIKKNGVLIPGGMDPISQMFAIAKQQTIDMAFENNCRIAKIKKDFHKAAQLPRKLKKRKRKLLNQDYSMEIFIQKNMGFDDISSLERGFDTLLNIFTKKSA